LYPQTLAGFLLVILLALSVSSTFSLSPTILSSFIIGLVAGLLVLSVPTFLVVVLLIFAWQVFNGGFRQRVVLAVAASLVVMVSTAGIWTIRNALVFQDFVLVSTNAGDNLIRGNAPGASPISGPGMDVEGYMALVAHLNEVDRDRHLQKIVYHIWQSDPVSSIQLYFGKVMNYFNYRNELVTQGVSSFTQDLVMGISYYLLLLLAVGRLAAWRIFPLHNLEKLAAGIYLFNAFYSAIVFTRIRYRLPFDYLLIILGASLLTQLITHREHLGITFYTSRRHENNDGK
jgi:hypothetical protein